MDDNPYRAPQTPSQPPEERRRDMWRMLLYGPSAPVALAIPLVLLVLVVMAALIVSLLV
jgi:hypothetical protein